MPSRFRAERKRCYESTSGRAVAAGVPPAVEPWRLARWNGVDGWTRWECHRDARAAGCAPATSGKTPDATSQCASVASRFRKFALREESLEAIFSGGLSDGVMVAQGPLEAFVMVRIHVGQPKFPQS
jgi:hypothetical protein